MTKWINTYRNVEVDTYNEVQNFINSLDGSDFDDYIKTNYSDYFDMIVEILQSGKTVLGETTYTNIIDLNRDLFEEMKMCYEMEWEPYDDDADCLKYESDD